MMGSLEKAMIDAAKNLEFEAAAVLRDTISMVRQNKLKISNIRSHLEKKLAKLAPLILPDEELEDSIEYFPGFQLLGTVEHVGKREIRKKVLKRKKNTPHSKGK